MWIDLGFLIFLLYGFYLGYSRGILKTLYAILAIVLAVLLTMKFSPIVIEFIGNSLKLGPTISLILGFLVCFLTIMFLVRLLGRGVEKLFKAAKINFINKLVGGVMMASLFVVSYAFILWFLNQSGVIPESQKEKSVTYEQIEPIPEKAKGTISTLKPAFKGFWDKSTQSFEESNSTTEPINNETDTQ